MLKLYRAWKERWLRIASAVRIRRLRMTQDLVIGPNSYIGPGCTIGSSGRRIRIGGNVTIVASAYLDGDITIGDNVILAPRVSILTRNHEYQLADALPYGTGYNVRPVRIHDNVWVGFGVSIAPGVTIGEGAVVAMASVVVHDVEPLAVVGGNPARPLTSRDAARYARLKAEGKHLNDIRGRMPHRRRYVAMSRAIFRRTLAAHGVVLSAEMPVPQRWRAGVLYALCLEVPGVRFGNLGKGHAAFGSEDVTEEVVRSRYSLIYGETLSTHLLAEDAGRRRTVT